MGDSCIHQWLLEGVGLEAELETVGTILSVAHFRAYTTQIYSFFSCCETKDKQTPACSSCDDLQVWMSPQRLTPQTDFSHHLRSNIFFLGGGVSSHIQL